VFTVGVPKANFFDREAVTKAADAGTRRILSRFGAFVRTRSRSSIRKRRDPSPPGTPPSSHVGTLRKLIFFSFDPAQKSVVIGPTLFRASSDVPRTLEEGGTVRADGRTIWVRRKPGRDAKGRFVSAGIDVIQTSGRWVYRPRPYMRPAFEAERRGKLAEQLKGFVHG
jgi:hypothetical protein